VRKEKRRKRERDPATEAMPHIPLMLESVESEDNDEPAAVDDGLPPTPSLIVTRVVNAGQMCHRPPVTEADEVGIAKGAACAKAVLLIIHRASPSATATVYNSMKTNTDSIVAVDVKSSLESVYKDISVTCEQVGRLPTDTGDYDEGTTWRKSKCTSKPQRIGKFVMSGMELEVKYGELGSLGAKSNVCVCVQLKKKLLLPTPVAVPAWTIQMLHLLRRMVNKVPV